MNSAETETKLPDECYREVRPITNTMQLVESYVVARISAYLWQQEQQGLMRLGANDAKANVVKLRKFLEHRINLLEAKANTTKGT